VKAVLQDLIKVVIDLQKKKNAETGGFELVYRALTEIQRPKGNMNSDFRVVGNSIIG
jgi:hypothetical protein